MRDINVLLQIVLEELSKKLQKKPRDAFKYCEDCKYEEKKKAGSSEIEEQLEFVMICLQCLHVGCTRKKQAHAESHFHDNKTHTLVRGIVGRLYCYSCDQDIEVDEDTKEKIAKIQVMFDYAISGPSINPAPLSTSSN